MISRNCPRAFPSEPPIRACTHSEKQDEHRIAAWICRHACSFVMFDTKARTTVIGFEHEDDADAFREEFVR